MTGDAIQRWRGAVALGRDSVTGASHAVERIHLETAGRTFGILARVPVVAAPAAVVRTIHDVTVVSVHALIRVTARAAAATLDIALHAAEGGR